LTDEGEPDVILWVRSEDGWRRGLIVTLTDEQWPAFVEEAQVRGLTPRELARLILDRFLRGRHYV
jgi:hypothetical protein